MKNKSTKDLQQLIQSTTIDKLDIIYEHITEYDFPTYLKTIMHNRNIKKSELIEKANLHRTYGYQILNGKKHPSRDKVLQLAITLQCNLEECNRLLTLAGYHILYAKNRRDSILIFSISRNLSLFEIEEYLEEYGQPLLVQYES